MTVTLVAIAGDLHINATTALCVPRFMLDDGGEYVASKPQRWIWRKWLEFWQEIGERRDSTGARLVVILNGETADNNKHSDVQLVTRNPADMVRLAAVCLEPVTNLLRDGDALFVLRGTEAHTGDASHLDEIVAQDLGAKAERPDGPASWAQLRAEFGGVRFDVAHHPPGGGGRRPWTRSSFAATLAAMAFFEAAERGVKAPHLLVRGHVHRPGDSYDAYPVRALILPSWKLQDAYAYRIGGGVLPIGGAFVECDGRGGYQVHKRVWEWIDEGYAKL